MLILVFLLVARHIQHHNKVKLQTMMNLSMMSTICISKNKCRKNKKCFLKERTHLSRNSLPLKPKLNISNNIKSKESILTMKQMRFILKRLNILGLNNRLIKLYISLGHGTHIHYTSKKEKVKNTIKKNSRNYYTNFVVHSTFPNNLGILSF